MVLFEIIVDNSGPKTLALEAFDLTPSKFLSKSLGSSDIYHPSSCSLFKYYWNKIDVTLFTLKTRILNIVFRKCVLIGTVYYSLACLSNAFLFILLGFSSTFSAAEESVVPLASPGHMEKKYEVSSQASPFSMYNIFPVEWLENNLSFYMSHREKYQS